MPGNVNSAKWREILDIGADDVLSHAAVNQVLGIDDDDTGRSWIGLFRLANGSYVYVCADATGRGGVGSPNRSKLEAIARAEGNGGRLGLEEVGLGEARHDHG